jgi:hypothetical protein
LDTGCGFWGKTEPVMANARSEKTLQTQAKSSIANEGNNPF